MSKDGALDQRFVVPVRTDLQVSPWEGPTGIGSADRRMVTEGGKTFQLAVPAQWTKEAKCLDDWKAFAGEHDPSPAVAKVLCDGCPVIEECLAAALEEEGDIAARFRAGVRGGLTPQERYDRVKPASKPCKRNHGPEYRKTRSNGFTYCGECDRIAGARRVRVRIECPAGCGKMILKQNRRTHMKSMACQNAAREAS